MSEFTKGPWHLNTTIFDGEPVGWEIIGRKEGSSNPIIVGMLKCSPSKPISKNIKDAQLIVTAPDMLCELQNSIVAIEKVRDFLFDNKDKLNCDDVIATLTIRIINNEHVIAKAKGES